jgi:HEAT repeat protein
MKRSSVIIFCVSVLASLSCAAQVQETRAPSDVVAPTGDDTQLEINKLALLTGSTEQMRVMAADKMLQSQDPRVRAMVMEIFKSPENAEARAAVCKVLSLSRGSSDSDIPRLEQFIEPLLATIKEIDQPVFPLAAEALLIYDYNTVGLPIEALAGDVSLDVPVRLNAMQALKLRLDKRAPIAMIRLVDDREPKVSEAAKAILHAIPIPVGNSPRDRDRIIEEMKRTSKDEFLRDWVFRQDERLQAERAEVEMLKRLYKDVLQEHYTQADTSAREAILLEHLKASQPFRKLWAIEQVYKWRTQARAELPDSLTPVLKGLISDSSKTVRLNAATQLFYIVKIDSADVLIQQLNNEKEAEVRIKLFAALGEACRTALIEDGVPDDIKAKTLTWAAKFLAESSADQAVKGAEVIARLLEKNGLAETDIDTYLGLLKGRFEQESQGNVVIKRKLLRTMALLCANPSGCKRQARVLYRPIFETCLEDESPLVREEAIQGLKSIDPKQALKELRTKLANDSNANVRVRVILLAKEVGTAEDLDWLYAKINAGDEVDVAWQAVLAILSRSDVKPLEAYYDRFTALRTQKKLTNSQWQGFLELALAKAGDRKKLLINVHQAFCDFSIETGAFERAREHLLSLTGLVDESGKLGVRAQVLGLELKSSRIKEASDLLNNELKARDLSESDILVQQVNAFLADNTEGKDPRAVVHSILKEMQATDARPKWEKVRSAWLSEDATLPEAVVDTNSPS